MLGAVTVFLLSSCAPEPTTPAKTSLAGFWVSDARAIGLSGMKMTIIQEPEGIVTGNWSARGDGGTGGCPPNVPCNAFGDLIGQNLVSQVSIELLGAGKFEGALVEPTRLRGILILGLANDTITFNRN